MQGVGGIQPVRSTHSTPSHPLPACEPAQGPDAFDLCSFLSLFCKLMLSVDANTSRVTRSAMRIAKAYDCRVDLAVFPRDLVLSVTAANKLDRRSMVITSMIGSPDFAMVAALNALSWRILDERLPLQQAKNELHAIMSRPRHNPILSAVLTSVATAAVARLFGGDFVAVGLVFVSVVVGHGVQFWLQSLAVNSKVINFLSAFAASMVAAQATLFHWGGTPQVALAASVLFLIPGVPLISATIDVLDGHILMGIARTVRAFISIASIALGLSFTMALLGVSAL